LLIRQAFKQYNSWVNPFRKRSTSSSSLSQTVLSKHSTLYITLLFTKLEERELSHSHPQFPRTTLGTPGTMTPHLAINYADDERLPFFDSGFRKKRTCTKADLVCKQKGVIFFFILLSLARQNTVTVCGV